MRLSKKHGLNPSMAQCYLCGEAKNEILLLGAQGDTLAKEMGHEDGEMPRMVCVDITPCDACKEKGVAIVEMDKEGPGAKPTGNRWLVKESAIRAML